VTDPAPDVHKIVLTPYDTGRDVAVGSVRTTADCGHDCWIAPSSRRVVADPAINTETLCVRCIDVPTMLTALAAQGGPLAVAGTRAELDRHLGVAETDQMFARYRIREHDPATGTDDAERGRQA